MVGLRFYARIHLGCGILLPCKYPIEWQRFIKQATTFTFHTNQQQSTTQRLLIFLYCTVPPKCALQVISPTGTRTAVALTALQMLLYTNEYQESRLLTKNVYILLVL